MPLRQHPALGHYMRTVLIHHDDSLVDRDVVVPWIASFSDLAGLVVIGEPRSNRRGRIRRELRRSGLLGFIDVLAFRLYHSMRFAKSDRRWEDDIRARLARRLPDRPSAIPTVVTHDPNSAASRKFIRARQPDLIVARCRVLLAKDTFSIPPLGTFVMHPGITPEYRNSHGCFWALSNRDLEHVGLSLVKIDEGVDTGPVFGYFTYAYDERRESHDVIQKRMLLENLDPLRNRLLEIERGEARPIDTSGRKSAVWGQPRLTSYIRWKRAVSSNGS
jgi:Formyl transferase